ncbi:NADH-quinone oxidoreductase subunit C [Saccharicrinis sp. FJH2]|uniref:NADH-quinone oxidoreductase subunit C n=1 Tax=Saccharicrinis sp. FJH65 TaxID=3344659 RepID=UPI0035F440AD
MNQITRYNMELNEIYQLLKDKFGDAIIEMNDLQPVDPYIIISPEKLFDICHTLRDHDQTQFDYLMSLSGMDYGENVGVVYHLYSMELKHKLVIKVMVLKDKPVVPSVERIWKSADWHEREAYDLVGIEFEGHHNMIRILCPYDWEGYPLRKDYVTPETYHGMKIGYE